MDLYKKTYEQPYPHAKRGKVAKKWLWSFYRCFDNSELWAPYSENQERHCTKLMELFFRLQPQRKWRPTPRNLYNKIDGLQQMLAKGQEARR